MRKKLIKSSVIRVKKAGVVIIPQIAIWMFLVARYGIVGDFVPPRTSTAPLKGWLAQARAPTKAFALFFSISV